jgi:hypothetical protein
LSDFLDHGLKNIHGRRGACHADAADGYPVVVASISFSSLVANMRPLRMLTTAVADQINSVRSTTSFPFLSLATTKIIIHIDGGSCTKAKKSRPCSRIRIERSHERETNRGKRAISKSCLNIEHDVGLFYEYLFFLY